MTSHPDRIETIAHIDEATTAGASQQQACDVIGISSRTVRRWRDSDGNVLEDQRPIVKRPVPPHALSPQEKQKIIDVCNFEEYQALPPCQIVPTEADKGNYWGSESSYYRVLKATNQLAHRGKAKAPKRRRKPTSYCADGPNQIWSWDITWLPTNVRGIFLYMYLIMDIYSRKAVGWEIHDRESAEHAALLIEQTCWREQIKRDDCLILHSDNGSPMKGHSMLSKLYQLKITPSFSRPRVSNDNPFSESLFRTCKYSSIWPVRSFNDVDQARQNWALPFFDYYNHKHKHSALKFVTPHQKHTGQDIEILQKRQELYQQQRQLHPNRWTTNTRNWQPISATWLNPDRKENYSDKLQIAA